MQRVLILFAHPGPRHSQTNCVLSQTAKQLGDITFVDLYAAYPRFKIDIDKEQQRLLEHDVIVFQFPLHWYSTPSLLKEWQDLVLEYGFAYGPGGDKLAGKTCLLAVTAGAPQDSYHEDATNRFALPTLLSPLQQTMRFCQMDYLPPYVLFSSLSAKAQGKNESHAKGYERLLVALRDEQFDAEAARSIGLPNADNLPLRNGGDT